METTSHQIKSLKDEFDELKSKLFGGQSFVLRENTQEWLRYEQLLAFFHPQFRTKSYINPLQ